MVIPSGLRWTQTLGLLVAPAVAAPTLLLLVHALAGRAGAVVAALLLMPVMLVWTAAASIRAERAVADAAPVLTEVRHGTGAALAAHPWWPRYLAPMGAAAGLCLTAAAGWTVGAVSAGTTPGLIGAAIGAAIGCCGFVARPVLGLVRGAPGVVVAADGVHVDGRLLPWDAIGELRLTGTGRRPVLRIERLSSRRKVRVSVHRATVNLVFLMDVIGYYRAHPGRRASIGLPGEQERLRRQLHVVRMSDVVRPEPAGVTDGW